jgi:hypothetical protein
VLGLPAGYRAAFPGEIRQLTGNPDGVLLAQQTAANLRAAPGDSVSIGRPGAKPVSVRVSGIIDLPQADSLFQKVGAPLQLQPSAPPPCRTTRPRRSPRSYRRRTTSGKPVRRWRGGEQPRRRPGCGPQRRVVRGMALGFAERMLVKVLTGVFDPPPSAIAVPWPYLTVTVAVAVGAIIAGALTSARGSSRPAVEELREL